jgi:isoleucyl-tRNA synthetase
VALDITLTDELKQEGDAREFVNRVQNIRKESGFELTDRIFVTVLETRLKPSIIKYNDYICREILADTIDWVPQIQDGTEIEINDTLLKVVVTKKDKTVWLLRNLLLKKAPAKKLLQTCS